MKIMIHQHHHCLPSYASSENTEGIPFSIEMGNFNRKRFDDQVEKTLLSDSETWHALLALHEYDASVPYVAHISLELDLDAKTWDYPKRIHLAIFSEDCKFELYSSEGNEYGLDELYEEENKTQETWRKFLLDKFNAKDLSIYYQIEDMQKEIDKLITIRDTYF